MRTTVLASALAALALSAVAAGASPFGAPVYTPQVPISSFARPAAWFDPSRLHVTAEMNFGTTFGGQSGGLQVTRFDYRFGAPLAMRVSVGNAFGAGVQNGGQFFLEGLDLAYRPFRSLTIQVNYRDVRSPLQMPYGYGYGYGARPWYAPGPFER